MVQKALLLSKSRIRPRCDRAFPNSVAKTCTCTANPGSFADASSGARELFSTAYVQCVEDRQDGPRKRQYGWKAVMWRDRVLAPEELQVACRCKKRRTRARTVPYSASLRLIPLLRRERASRFQESDLSRYTLYLSHRASRVLECLTRHYTRPS